MNGNHFEVFLTSQTGRYLIGCFLLLIYTILHADYSAILSAMRNQRNGRIANVSSMGGRIAIPLDLAYHGTKFDLEGASESLQYEVEQFGIKIIIMESVNNS